MEAYSSKELSYGNNNNDSYYYYYYYQIVVSVSSFLWGFKHVTVPGYNYKNIEDLMCNASTRISGNYTLIELITDKELYFGFKEKLILSSER